MRELTSKMIYAAFAVMLAASGWSCSDDARPNILLITVDTLRPDRLGYAGGRGGVSPAIDGLAATGTVYSNAFSVSGWTLPSVATILTGRYPQEHGATDFKWPVDEAHPSIATLLRSRNYDTAGFVSHLVLRAGSGIENGFDLFDESVLQVGHPHEVATAANLTDLAIEDLKEADSPFFLWVHYFDPHFDYLTHEAYKNFGDTDLDRYDQEIAYTDHHIGRLLSWMDAHGLTDNTLIIFTADHGEEFGEHEGKHHYTLFDEVVRVPFIVKGPGVNSGVDDRLVEQVDVLPTVLAAVGLDGSGFPGHNLLVPAPRERFVYFERERPPGWQQRGIRTLDRKLLIIDIDESARGESRRRYATVTNLTPGLHLYDLTTDPGEQRDIYDDDAARALLVELGRHTSDIRRSARAIEVDDALQKKLRSLGYIR